ncbi:unnamed protein product [Linum trigynum]|uniref:Secreted protein n=1 Tax=Linum trigynum TaxID=586398 RepID=A0AAV2DWT6_9ROSI
METTTVVPTTALATTIIVASAAKEEGVVDATPSLSRVELTAAPDVKPAMKELALAPKPSPTSPPVITVPTVPSIVPPSEELPP